MHQIGLGRLISIEMLQVWVPLLGKHRVIPFLLRLVFSMGYRILFDLSKTFVKALMREMSVFILVLFGVKAEVGVGHL